MCEETLTDAEAWWEALGRKVPRHGTDEWEEMYQAWMEEARQWGIF